MCRFLAFACMLAVAAQLSAAFYSGDANGRMVGGDVVSDSGAISFQVAIQPTREQGGVSVDLPVCSGIVIKGTNSSGADLYYVLTSATCVLSGTSCTIYLGTNKITVSTTPDFTTVSTNAIIHPSFLQTFTTADLALIPDAPTEIIKNAVEATTITKIVRPALLPNLDNAGKGYMAHSVRMSGWGFPNSDFAAASPQLRSLTSRVVPNFYCQAINLGKPIDENILCTGGLYNKGPCTGDSGAPLVATADNLRVIGLATLTPANGCSHSKPGVFTSLGRYLTWIQRQTNYDVQQ